MFRAVFLTSFQGPAGIGFLRLKVSLDGRMGGSHYARLVVGLIVGLLFLAIVNGALRALSPLLADLHKFPIP